MSLILDYLFPCTCAGCGRVGDYLCPRCQSLLSTLAVRREISPFDGIISVFKYNGSVKKLITDIKFEFVTDIVPELIDLITKKICLDFPSILKFWQQNQSVLVPVPLHQYRQNYRGFNQSILIASELSSRLKLPVNPDLVSRTRFSVAQSSLSRTQRQKNIDHSYRLNTPSPKSVILVDDVCTTGATLKSIASAFPKSTNLWALTLAG